MQYDIDDAQNLADKEIGTFSIRQLMAFQLRIALALIVIVPFIYEIQRYWDRLNPSAYAWIAITFILPLLALIFLVNEKTLLWVSSLILITIAGGAIGFSASYLGFPNRNVGDHLLLSAIPAILTWFVAVRIRNRKGKSKTSDQIVG